MMSRQNTRRQRGPIKRGAALLLLLAVWAAASPARAQGRAAPRTPLEAYERATEPLREWARAKEQTLEGNIRANREQERRARAYLSLFRVADWRGEQLFGLGRLGFVALRPASTESALSAYLRNPAADKATTARTSLLWALVAQKKWEPAAAVAELLLDDPRYDADADAYVQQLIKNSHADGYARSFALAKRWLPSLFRLASAEENSSRATALLVEALDVAELFRESGGATASDELVASFLEGFRQSRLAEDARAKQGVETVMRRMNLLGTRAPALVGTDYLGVARADAATFGGRVVLLDFFAHWCAPCVNELPILDGLRSKYGAEGLEVIGVTQYYGFFGERKEISAGQELDALRGLKAERRARQGFVVGPPSNFEAYGVGGLPFLVFIDRAGRVRAVRTGGAGGAQIETLIQKLLAEPGAPSASVRGGNRADP